MLSVACQSGRVYRFQARRTALLMIDFQRDFLDPEGFCAAAGVELAAMGAVVPGAATVLAAARRHGLHVIHTREGYAADHADMHALKRERLVAGRRGPLGRFLIRGEPGQATIAELSPRPGEPEFDKPGFSAFFRSPLEALLLEREVTHLVLAGITTQCCVHSTLRSAVDRGYWCLTLADCCAALRLEWHEAAIALIASEDDLFGWVAHATDFIAALSTSATPSH